MIYYFREKEGAVLSQNLNVGKFYRILMDFYNGKKVLVTGNTGFKGSWLTLLLLIAGADVTGYALESPTNPNLFSLTSISKQIRHINGDIRDYEHLNQVFDEVQPEMVFHLAAQPIVRTSYQKPRYTYETNVMGTVNICECVRLHPCVKSFLNVTTDKVYQNKEWCWGYRENEPLDGFDPYSNSKSCSELVTHAYINSFFKDIAVSTARAGNVIGGGDFSVDRIIPDCVRAVISGNPLQIRNPDSIRPYQHVLEPLYLYMTICAEQYKDASKAGFYNIGPDDKDSVTTQELVKLFAKYYGEGFSYKIQPEKDMPHEANFLKLDTNLVKSVFSWKPLWNIEKAVEKTVEWSRSWLNHENMEEVTISQIKEYLKERTE